MPNPFSGFFDGVGDKQRSGANKRPQRVADHVVYLCHAESIAVLDVLNPCAEDAADERREGNSTPTVPLQRQRIRQRQPQRKEKKDVHQHLAVEFRLLLGGGEGREGREDELIVARRAGQQCGVRNQDYEYSKQIDI